MSNEGIAPRDPSRSFDRRFEPERRKVSGIRTTVVDVSPERLDLAKSRPVLFAPGFMETFSVNKGPMRVLVDSGRRVISLEHPRWSGFLDETYNEYSLSVQNRLRDQSHEWPDVDARMHKMDERWEEVRLLETKESVRRALALLSVIEATEGVDKVDIVARSEGAIDAAIAKYLNPERIGNIVLVNPAGMLDKDGLWRLGKASVAQERRKKQAPFEIDVLDEQSVNISRDILSPSADLKSMTRYVANPVRAGKDIGTILHTNIEFFLNMAQEEGSHIGWITTEDDLLFPTPELPDNFQGIVDEFVRLPGDHNAYKTDPRIMRKADELLTTLAAI